jgi:TrmH family RNA methyltransferase
MRGPRPAKNEAMMLERVPQIRSKQNPLIRHVKQLQARTRVRKKKNAFVVEGEVFISLAIESDHRIETLLYCEALLVDDVGRSLAQQLQADNVYCVGVTQEVFEHVSQRNNPDGLAAIVTGGRIDVASLEADKADLFVCLSDIADPGNLGTILRTIDSAGASTCILVGDSTDPYHPRAVRASRGSLFSVRVVHAASMDAIWAWARQQNVHTVATSPSGGQSYWHAPYPRPLLLILGNEHEGLPPATLDAVDQLVTIPMWGKMSSLNVAVAASLLLYEIRRRESSGAGPMESI